MSELSMVVDRLTVETPQVVATASGPVVIRARPLLVELQDALHPSGEAKGGAGGSASGSGAPLDMTALRLMCQVQDEATHLQWLMRSAGPVNPLALTLAAQEFRVAPAAVAGPPRPGFGGLTLLERIRWVAVRATALGREAEVLAVVRPWVLSVERLLDPPKVVALRGVECPACGVAKTPVWDADHEELVDTPALVVTMGTTPRARCGECGAEWVGPEVVDLATQCGAAAGQVAHLLGG
ncbi:hypothetical protein AB0302_04540 [Micrococcus sp. NPDC078436]|uniref:DUF7341 domain-containing protein n=1 Tax=Micrococcus sp. NPDC078436 TaxID=3154960 RepID=UPI00344B0F02